MKKNNHIIKGFNCLNIITLTTVIATGSFCLYNLLKMY